MSDNVFEIKKDQNIYQKLGEIQVELLKMNIPKTGKNKFSGFEYHELEDLLPPIIILLNKYNMMHYFNFPVNEMGECHKGILILKDFDNEDELRFEVPFPELVSLNKGMNVMQSEGSYITYLKRYLLINAFGIVEKEFIDATSNSTNESNDEFKVNTQSEVVVGQKPEVFQKVVDRCRQEYPNEECDKKLLNKVSMKMFKTKEISKKQRIEMYDFLFKKNKS